MKFIFTLFLLTISIFGSEIKWSDSYYSALTDAKKEHKVLWILVTKESCRWCKKFEATTLQDKDIVSNINAHFKAVNIVKEKNVIPAGLTPKMFPYHYFIDSQSGKVIDEYPGYLNVEAYTEILDDALVAFRKNNAYK